MIINLGKLKLIHTIIMEIVEIKLPIESSYRISRFMSGIEKDIEFFDAEIKKMIFAYSEKDENGIPLSLDGGESIKINEDDIEQFKKELSELESIETVIPDYLLKLQDFDKTELPPIKMVYLLEVIKEEDD